MAAGATLEWADGLLQLCSALGLRGIDHEGGEDDQIYRIGAESLEVLKDLLRNLRIDVRNEMRPVLRQLGQFEILQKDLVPMLIQYCDDPKQSKLILTLLKYCFCSGLPPPPPYPLAPFPAQPPRLPPHLDTAFISCSRVMTAMTLPAFLVFQYEGQGQVNEKLEATAHYRQVELYLTRYKAACISYYRDHFDPEVTETSDQAISFTPRALKALMTILYEPVTAELRSEQDENLIELILTLLRNILHAPNPQMDNVHAESLHDKAVRAFNEAGVTDLVLGMCNNMGEFEPFKMMLLEIVSLLFREQSPQALFEVIKESRHQKVASRRDDKIRKLHEEEQAKRQATIKHIRTARHSRFAGHYAVRGLGEQKGREVLTNVLALQTPTNINNSGKAQRTKRALLERAPDDRRSPLEVRMILYRQACAFIVDAYNVLMPAVAAELERYAESVGMQAEVLDYDRSNYLKLMQFCMQLHRLQLEEDGCHADLAETSDAQDPPGYVMDPIATTLSLNTLDNVQSWLQEYFDKMLERALDAKLWSHRLHTAIRAFHELMQYASRLASSPVEEQRDYATNLISNAFYREEFLDVFPKLLIRYNARSESDVLLRDIVRTVHVVLKLLNSNTTKLYVKKKRQTRRKKKTQPKAKGQPEGASSSNAEVAKPKASKSAGKTNMDADDLGGVRDTALDELFSDEEGDGDKGADDTANPTVTGEGGLNDEELEHYLQKQEDIQVQEAEFQFNNYLEKFKDFRVVKAYVEVLARYRYNGREMNHFAVKMLDRIVNPEKLNARQLLYQLSVLRVFLGILEDDVIRKQPEFAELRGFIKSGVIKDLIEDLGKNPLLFVELMFTKTTGDLEEIQHGYAEALRRRNHKVVSWSPEEEAKIQLLYKEHQESGYALDEILAAFPDRSERSVKLKMKKMGLVISDSRVWTPEEDAILKAEFAKIEGASDPIVALLESGQMPSNKSTRRQLGMRLRKLGLYEPPHYEKIDAELASQLDAAATELRSMGMTGQLALSTLIERMETRATALEADKASDEQLAIFHPDDDDEEDIAELRGLMGLLKFEGVDAEAITAWRMPADTSAQHLRDLIDALSPPGARTKESVVLQAERDADEFVHSSSEEDAPAEDNDDDEEEEAAFTDDDDDTTAASGQRPSKRVSGKKVKQRRRRSRGSGAKGPHSTDKGSDNAASDDFDSDSEDNDNSEDEELQEKKRREALAKLVQRRNARKTTAELHREAMLASKETTEAMAAVATSTPSSARTGRVLARKGDDSDDDDFSAMHVSTPLRTHGGPNVPQTPSSGSRVRRLQRLLAMSDDEDGEEAQGAVSTQGRQEDTTSLPKRMAAISDDEDEPGTMDSKGEASSGAPPAKRPSPSRPVASRVLSDSEDEHSDVSSRAVGPGKRKASSASRGLDSDLEVDTGAAPEPKRTDRQESALAPSPSALSSVEEEGASVAADAVNVALLASLKPAPKHGDAESKRVSTFTKHALLSDDSSEGED
ncbi:uncharacterized protein MONBRDRAFT_28544 [Monosiga brevicollis MX1]|uniref:Timeless N-terminal domain-containing protein n=1 Tax=Monosiga brevicollis TaxID=81824 RepID=A9V8H3_MONBE|nr:uncharacterized protein MONBRDRAFT_28544 [Monosiga brevicollis MX1]EDQ86145.1 predicted protein [Monosiga brevicollis MX1]|eukprot:XP_001749070.1 hypothetical protein [Monosiga brevicollis MX1]